ncbi:MAG: SHOCT domain-containing protein [Pseudomonadota bacterium]
MTKAVSIIVMTLMLSACWNGENVHVQLGDVSFGQQLIDLKRALDEDAISEREYERAKARLLDMASLCEDADDEHRDHHRHEDDDDDGFNWF